jgi:Zn-dependent protease with chaperone function
VWSVSWDYILRKFILWVDRYFELRADRGAVNVGMEKELRNALIRNYAANKDPLFVSDLTVITQKSHPSMLQRLEALKKPVRGTN